MKWALAQSSSDWYYHDIALQNEMINHNDSEFKRWLDKYKYYERHPENTLEFYRDKCVETLSHYEISLGKTSYLLGDNIRLVDVAIFPFVRQCANIDREWFVFKFPNLERWLESWIQSEIFNRVMPKYKAWRLDAPPLYISFHLGGK
jgi:glutathione S-transferase